MYLSVVFKYCSIISIQLCDCLVIMSFINKVKVSNYCQCIFVDFIEFFEAHDKKGFGILNECFEFHNWPEVC